ncbi:hypothetical protein AALB39_17955 [Lachnospiraceae bacterium 54-53]
MKMRKTYLRCLVFIVLSTFILTLPAYASESPKPFWSYMIAMSGRMSVNSFGLATITAECRADALTVDKVNLKCELQQLDGTWKTIKTWAETDNSNAALFSKNYAIYKNYSYRLKITSSAYSKNTLLESVSEYFDYGYYQ